MKKALIVKNVVSILKILGCGFVIWSVGFIAGVFYHDSETGVGFRITNNGSRQLSRVQVLFRGGECNLDTIDPRKSVDLRLNISGKSDLSLSFLDGCNQCKQTISVYMDRGSTDFAVTIGENGEIHLVNSPLP